MRSPHVHFPTHAGRSLLAAALILAGGLILAPAARAQVQDRVVAERLEKAGTLEYVPAAKTFIPTTSGVNRTATVKLFGFSRPATLSGNSRFKTEVYTEKKSYKTDGYSTRPVTGTDRAASLTDRSYDLKTVSGQPDRAANKSADTQHFLPSGKVFVSQGKRQDEMDELRRQKQLTSDQVREILNKNR